MIAPRFVAFRSALAASLLLAATALAAGPLGAAEELAVGPERRTALTLTVYNQDLALVGERRKVAFAAGENRLAILGVSRLLRPESVILSGADLMLIEQGFDVDLLTGRRLLDRALGGRVWVRRLDPDGGGDRYLEGTLISIAETPLVRIGERLEQVPQGALVFEAGLLGTRGGGAGFRDRPTLFATLESAAAGERDLGIAYLTSGLSWQADYVAALNAAEDRLDLSALITVSNGSGTDFEDAALRLVAGQVNQVGGGVPMPQAEMMMARGAMADMAMAAAPAPVQPVGDQHLYSLPKRISLANRETKQVGLLDASGVAVAKTYRFDHLINAYGGAEEIGPVKAMVRLEIENDEASGLGRALPEGVVRVYKEGPGGGPAGAAPVFLGEDRIGHTADGETLRLAIGEAFDVTGRSIQTAYEQISNKTYETAQEITVENAKEEAIEAVVVGPMPPGWRMIDESLPHEAETANRLAWTLPVPAAGEAKFRYRIRVTRR